MGLVISELTSVSLFTTGDGPTGDDLLALLIDASTNATDGIGLSTSSGDGSASLTFPPVVMCNAGVNASDVLWVAVRAVNTLSGVWSSIVLREFDVLCEPPRADPGTWSLHSTFIIPDNDARSVWLSQAASACFTIVSTAPVLRIAWSLSNTACAVAVDDHGTIAAFATHNFSAGVVVFGVAPMEDARNSNVGLWYTVSVGRSRTNPALLRPACWLPYALDRARQSDRIGVLHVAAPANGHSGLAVSDTTAAMIAASGLTSLREPITVTASVETLELTVAVTDVAGWRTDVALSVVMDDSPPSSDAVPTEVCGLLVLRTSALSVDDVCSTLLDDLAAAQGRGSASVVEGWSAEGWDVVACWRGPDSQLGFVDPEQVMT